MKIVIATDSYKGSLTSLEAGNAIKAGILNVVPDAEVIVRPIADGGEGTVHALADGMNGKITSVTVTGPLGMPVSAEYAIIEETHTAIIEMAEAAGIALINKNELNPLKTTTYGVGEIIKDAIANGCRNFIIGIGGSATNDGGVGMLMALGYEFLDESGKTIALGAEGLKDLNTIKDNHVIPELKNCKFNIACDVSNPLCGENGCSKVFGPQKGATKAMIGNMDKWLMNYAILTKRVNINSDINANGAGAAGGLGFAFLAYLNATLESGIKIILKETKLENYIIDADIVITGEGRLDSQTVMGKTPIGIAHIAKKHKKPVIAFSGCVTKDASIINEHGIDAFFPILREVTSLEENMKSDAAKSNLTASVEQVFRLINTRFHTL